MVANCIDGFSSRSVDGTSSVKLQMYTPSVIVPTRSTPVITESATAAWAFRGSEMRL